MASAAGKAAARAAELEGRRDHGKTMGKPVGKSWENHGEMMGNMIGKVWRICQESDDSLVILQIGVFLNG